MNTNLATARKHLREAMAEHDEARRDVETKGTEEAFQRLVKWGDMVKMWWRIFAASDEVIYG